MDQCRLISFVGWMKTDIFFGLPPARLTKNGYTRGAAPLRQDPPDKGRQKAAGRAQQDRDSFDPKARSTYHISL